MQLPNFSSSMVHVLLSGALASGLTILIGKLLNRRREPVVECILFSPNDMHVSRTTFPCAKPACPLCNFHKLTALLRTATLTLDVCVYLITEPELANIIIRLHKRGVKVRIITDKQMSEDAYKCKVGLFVKSQIPIKYLDVKGMMHNKFFIIDGKLLATGSCNWTQQGFMNNFENLLIVRDEQVLEQFNEHFRNLWYRVKFI